MTNPLLDHYEWMLDRTEAKQQAMLEVVSQTANRIFELARQRDDDELRQLALDTHEAIADAMKAEPEVTTASHFDAESVTIPLRSNAEDDHRDASE